MILSLVNLLSNGSKFEKDNNEEPYAPLDRMNVWLPLKNEMEMIWLKQVI